MRAVMLAMVVVSGCGGTGEEWGASYQPSSSEPANEVERSGEASVPSVESGLPRKIIYTANVTLVVEDFDPIPDNVSALAAQFGGYVARSNVSGSPGQPRRGSWTIRVPVDRYPDLLSAVQQLGEPRSTASDSRDVSDEYYDIESRIRNKKNTESRLLVLLEESTGNLEQILSVEEKLDRVREEIERMEGRIRVLDDLTSMTTIELTIDEIKDFSPQQSATYGTRIRRAFDTSVDNLSQTAQDLSVGIVYLLPWLAVLAAMGLFLAAIGIFARKLRKRPDKRVVTADVVESPPE